MERNFQYVGLVLTEESRQNLLGRMTLPENSKEFLHHMTICHISHKLTKDDSYLEKLEGFIGTEVKVTVESLGISKKAWAFGIKKSEFTDSVVLNDRPHVTLCTFPENGGKPVDSNWIEDWYPISPIEITGIVTVVK